MVSPILLNVVTKLSNNSLLARSRLSGRSYVELSKIFLSEVQAPLPDPPTTCCMSGCANCVWIEYAEELTKIVKDGGEKVKEIVMEKVDDPNMKAFLLTELKFLQTTTTSDTS